MSKGVWVKQKDSFQHGALQCGHPGPLVIPVLQRAMVMCCLQLDLWLPQGGRNPGMTCCLDRVVWSDCWLECWLKRKGLLPASQWPLWAQQSLSAVNLQQGMVRLQNLLIPPLACASGRLQPHQQAVAQGASICQQKHGSRAVRTHHCLSVNVIKKAPVAVLASCPAALGLGSKLLPRFEDKVIQVDMLMVVRGTGMRMDGDLQGRQLKLKGEGVVKSTAPQL